MAPLAAGQALGSGATTAAAGGNLAAFAAATRHARNPRRAVTNFEIVPSPKPVAFTPNAP